MSGLAYNSFLLYFLIAAAQGILLSIIIVSQRSGKNTGKYLGALIFLFSLSILHGVLEDSIHAFNGKFPVPMNYTMLYGPLAFFHIKSLINPKFRFTKKELLHFVPSVVFDVLFFSLLFAYAGTHMEWAYENIFLIRIAAFGVGLLSFFHLLFYTYQIYRALKESQFLTNTLLGSIKGWLKMFSFFWVLGITISAILIPIVYLSMNREDYGYNLFFPIGIVDSIIVYCLGYSYLIKYRRTIEQYLQRSEKAKYSKSEIATKREEIIGLLKNKSLFRDQELNVKKLSEELGWSSKELSQLIGDAFGTNFNELVNTYRIEAFLSLAATTESKKYSIDGLAKDVGFNSKASFYRSFKKMKGMTPLQYLSNQ